MNKVFLLSFVIFLLSCSTGTSPNNRVTFSGTVTLDGASDNAGVTLALYKTVELDTAITNERDRHAGIGVALSQRTEFFWRVEKAVYTTTTTADGSWEIKDVAPDKYNIVAQAHGYGWRVLYEQPNSAKSTIDLPKPVILKGSYFEPLSIPSNSFVIIDGRVTFNFADLTVGAGTIIEFRNNGKLDTNGNLDLNGIAGNQIYLVPQDTSKAAEVFVHEASNCRISHVQTNYVKNGYYIKNTANVTFDYNYIHFTNTAVELFNCLEVSFKNNMIADARLGLNISTCKADIQKNIFARIRTNGIEYFDNPGSEVTKNVFKQCLNGFAINFGGFRTSDSQLNLSFNDFLANTNHIFMGYKVRGGANFNNFYSSTDYDVKCKGRFIADTLDFKNNFWNSNSNATISQKILDASDFDTGSTIYPFIDFVPFESTKNGW